MYILFFMRVSFFFDSVSLLAGSELIIPCDRGRTRMISMEGGRRGGEEGGKVGVKKVEWLWRMNGKYFSAPSTRVSGNGSLIFSRLKPFHEGKFNISN